MTTWSFSTDCRERWISLVTSSSQRRGFTTVHTHLFTERPISHSHHLTTTPTRNSLAYRQLRAFHRTRLVNHKRLHTPLRLPHHRDGTIPALRVNLSPICLQLQGPRRVSLFRITVWENISGGKTQGRRSWRLGGPDPLKICRRGRSMF